MVNLINNQANSSPTTQKEVGDNPFVLFQYDWRKTMNPINNNISLNQTQKPQNIETKVNLKRNTLLNDTFDQKEKTKKIAKYSAIGAGIAAIAYSAFALIKYKKVRGFLPRLAEPIKVLAARINPNGFKPKISIEENEMKYLGDVSIYLTRLKLNQKKEYINYLYSKTIFTEQGKNDFIRHFGRYIER